jgi:hypothetical protein
MPNAEVGGWTGSAGGRKTTLILWNSYGILWKSYGNLWNNTRAIRPQRAERAGAGGRGSGELTEVRSLARRAEAEGFAGWRGRGRKEAAKVKVPASGFDWAPDGIPDSNFSDEPVCRGEASSASDFSRSAARRSFCASA